MLNQEGGALGGWFAGFGAPFWHSSSWHSRVSLTPEPESWSGLWGEIPGIFQVYPGFSGMPAKDTVAIADFGPKPPSDSRLRARNTSRRRYDDFHASFLENLVRGNLYGQNERVLQGNCRDKETKRDRAEGRARRNMDGWRERERVLKTNKKSRRAQ